MTTSGSVSDCCLALQSVFVITYSTAKLPPPGKPHNTAFTVNLRSNLIPLLILIKDEQVKPCQNKVLQYH